MCKKLNPKRIIIKFKFFFCLLVLFFLHLNIIEVIKANGVDTDTVHVDTDDVQIFTYNLSKYVGKKVSIRITLANNATHCVITQISQK